MITPIQPNLTIKSPKVAFASQKPTQPQKQVDPFADTVILRGGKAEEPPQDKLVYRFFVPAINGNIKALMGFLEGPVKQGELDINATLGGYSALHVAAGFAKPESIKALVQAGADPNIKDNRGETPLFYALISGDLPPIRALLDAGADPVAANNEGVTPLEKAYRQGNLEAATLMQGAPKFLQDHTAAERTEMIANAYLKTLNIKL